MAAALATPPTRTRKLRNVDSPLSSVGFLTDNDDLEERRARRRSKILTTNILSPGGVQSSPARGLDKDRRKSVNLSNNGMTNVQIKEHYSNCIKLSSENKINAKNAFGLHLIDYMKDLLRQSQKEESGTNFQIASCTLDAGVKIYAYRVDSVHSEAYKVLGSLGRAVDNPENNENNNEQEGHMEDGETQQKQVKRKKYTGKTIETNLKNINCEQYDLDAEIDPFFHKISAAFDEGGTAGLLSYQLHSKTNSNDLMMDSAIKFSSFPVRMTEELSKEGENNDMVPITQLKELYKRISIDNKEICPQFKSFQFIGWDKDSQDIAGSVFLPDDSFNDNVHRFDVNAPVVPDASDSYDTGGGGDYDDYDGGMTESDYQIDGMPAQSGDALSNVGTLNSSSTTFPILSLQPSEYSYFNQDHMSMWAGPLHWKVKPLSKEKNTTASTTSKSTTKKEQIFIDFEKDIDMKKLFGTGRGATYLKDATIEKHATQLTVLPPDLHYQAETLFQIFIRDNISLKRQAVAAQQVDTEDENWYDYDNKNDREGFCPIVNDDDGGDYDDDIGGCSPGGDASFAPSQQPIVVENGAFMGDNLVAPPDKVRVTDINYAKAAKRIDVKKLKSTMWKMLCQNENEEKENSKAQSNLPKPVIETEDGGSDKSQVSGLYTFKSMYNALPTQVSQNMAKNLSGPIAFVCLLYLANEKTLKLTGKEDMSDIVIEEGI